MKRVICVLILAISSILICQPSFVDINAGLTGVNYSSTAWGDYDNDNDLDVIISGYTGSVRSTKIYRNDSGGIFTDLNVVLEQVNGGSLEWGDYDNDGYLDILLTGSNGTTWITRIYHNNGDGTFTDINAGITGAIDGGTSWGDYDNDGDLDLVITGNTGSGYISEIFRNDSNGIFTDLNAGLTPVTESSVAWSDYDNDGDLDILLTGNTGAARISKIYRNNAGVFSDINAGLPGVRWGSCAWGDYDNDGDLDILLTGFTGTELISRIFRNDSGMFTNINAVLLNVYLSSVAWGDYDNDGDLDILLTGLGSSNPLSIIYRNNGNDTFTDINAGLTGVMYSSVDWGDYDNDGDLDILLTGQPSSGYISKIYRNTSTLHNTKPSTPTNLSTVVIGSTVTFTWNKSTDVETPQNGLSYNLYIGTSAHNEDVKAHMSNVSTGYRKVVSMGNTNKTNSWVIKGLPAGTYFWGVQSIDNAFAGSAFTSECTFGIVPAAPVALEFSNATSTSFMANWQASEAADGYKIDVDDNSNFLSPLAGYNNLDIGNVLSISVSGLTGGPTYYYRLRAYNEHGLSTNSNVISAQTLSFFTDNNAGLAAVMYSSVDWGDYDNDSDLDILMTGYTGSVYISRIYQNNTGIFSDINAGLPGVSIGSVAWGDYDNDGDLDILMTGNTGSIYISRIYRNDSGVFTDINAGLPGVTRSSVAWGDYDNDGDLDILMTGNTGSVYISRIYRNDSGVFIDINAGLIGVQQSSVAWGDYDNDSDLDILLTGQTNSYESISKIYRNDSGVFTEINAGLIGVQQSSVAWGDYDNDGDLDILLTGISINQLSLIYRNNGNDTFTDIEAGLIGSQLGSAGWGDYDNDGDLDIVITGETGSGRASKVYRNDVSNIFTEINAGLIGIAYSSVEWGDYDNDSDLDILLTGYSGSFLSNIYTNNCETPNTAPGKPSKLVTAVENETLKLSFNPASDAQTPQNGLSYELEINLNGHAVTPSMSDPSNGFRRIVKPGYTTNSRNYYLRNFSDNLPQEEKTIIWKAQAIDQCFAGSEFASTGDIIFPSQRDLIISSNTLMTETDLLKWEFIYPEMIDHYIIQLDDDEYFRSPIEETYTITKNCSKEKSDDGKLVYLTKRLNELADFGEMISNETYYWRVKPVYTKTNCVTIFSETPHSFLFNPIGTAPNPPISGFNPSNDDIESSLPKLSWNVAVDPDGHAEDLYYICQLDTANAFTTIQYADTTATGISSIQVASALPEGYRYYYRVKTVDADALQSVWSAVQTFLIVMPPQDVKITDDGTNVNLTWDAIPVNTKGVVYTVYSSANPYAEFPTGWTVAAAQLTSPSWSEPHSAAKKFYRITAGSSSK